MVALPKPSGSPFQKIMRRAVFVATVAGALTALSPNGAMAQSCLGRPDFDACMAAINSANMSRNQAAQAQTFQTYMTIYGPMLQQQYRQYRGPMTFGQFAYWNMMTANGTNVQGALDAQRRQFEGNQIANQTVQQGYSSYRQGMYNNSQTTDHVAERYDQNAIRGNSAQIDPSTGQTVWLPYAQPYNQPFSSGGQQYYQNQNGYYQYQGNGWTPMQPGQ